MSYGRGAGYAMTFKPGTAQLECVNREQNGALCYDWCKSGYKGVGPVCWNTDPQSYPRGVGNPQQATCDNGKQLENGLCYSPCNPGYKGNGPVCWNQQQNYDRGVGTVATGACNGNADWDAALCYTPCNSGYHGVGPVCWQNTPPGFVTCGAGFAKSDTICAEITANQAAAALGALSIKKQSKAVEEVNAVSKSANPEKVKGFIDSAKELFEALKDIGKGVTKIDKEHPNQTISVASNLISPQTAENLQNLFAKAEELKLYQRTPAAIKVLSKLRAGETLTTSEQINEIRQIADALQFGMIALEIVTPPIAESPAFQAVGFGVGVISAYAYPVYGKS